jgi:endoglucanase
MPGDGSKQLLPRLSLAAGPPGAEDEVRAIVRETLAGIGSVRYDRLGSILCEKRGAADEPRVMLDSHLDEVALLVQSVSSEGKLAFVPLGGWWGHVLLGQRVEVLSERGKVPGVIGATPPHFLSKEKREEVLSPDKMYVDIGASDLAQVERLGVRIGDAVVPASDFREMAVDHVFSGKALDNRLGVALMCETLLALRNRDHPNTVVGVGAVQEELGMRGAGTASELARPDVAIILECTPADDLPGQTERQAILGKGPQIRLFDPTAVSNRRLVGFVESVAADCGIGFQLAVRRTGGTDAGSIQRSHAGVPTVVVGVPARYIHSHVGLFDWRDYVAARELVLAVVLRLDAARTARFTRFDQS